MTKFMIVVISDIHDNLPNLSNALTYTNSIKASALFVLGDVTNADTLKYIGKNFPRDIYLVSGNMEVCDLEAEAKKYPQIHYLGRQGGIIKIGQHTVGLCHEPFLIDNLLCHPERSRSGVKDPTTTPSIIFYGHTHKPWEETISLPAAVGGLGRGLPTAKKEESGGNAIKLINPGNLANTFYAPSFAVWDETTDKLGLKIL